jgi:hypothetical protein
VAAAAAAALVLVVVVVVVIVVLSLVHVVAPLSSPHRQERVRACDVCVAGTSNGLVEQQIRLLLLLRLVLLLLVA